MKIVLRVTWQNGPWDHESPMPTTSIDLHPRVSMELAGDTLAFKDGSGISLAVPDSRLVSAVRMEIPE